MWPPKDMIWIVLFPLCLAHACLTFVLSLIVIVLPPNVLQQSSIYNFVTLKDQEVVSKEQVYSLRNCILAEVQDVSNKISAEI